MTDWRTAYAERAASEYIANPKLAALVIAGSVGSGLADRWSDLELDCYWHEPPTDDDRRAPVQRLGAQLDEFWDYDPGDREWSENYRVGDLPVTISNFTVADVDAMVDDVVLRIDTDPVKHMRLSAITRGRVVHGADVLDRWREKADTYPDALVDAMVEKALAPDVLAGWSARYALAARGDTIVLHDLVSRIERAFLAALCAVNRTYVSHTLAKWQNDLIARLAIKPAPSGTDDLHQGDAFYIVERVQRVVRTVVDIVEQHTTADIGEFREALRERRMPIDQPEPD